MKLQKHRGVIAALDDFRRESLVYALLAGVGIHCIPKGFAALSVLRQTVPIVANAEIRAIRVIGYLANALQDNLVFTPTSDGQFRSICAAHQSQAPHEMRVDTT